MVWCAMSSSGIIGPYIFRKAVTSKNYHRMLSFFFFPKIVGHHCFFQQDGAGPHVADLVVNYLDNKCPGSWIGKRGPVNWPARSPDLTPNDFFLWGYLRERVYRTSPTTLDKLEELIKAEVCEIDAELCARVIQNVTSRLERVIERNGGSSEH